MNPPRGHRHAHRDPGQVLAQRRWVAPVQNDGYREVLEPVLHHAIEGMGQCAQPEPECVDVPEAAGASVQEPIVLLFLDPVFGLALVAVHRFVDRLRAGLPERGDDEATVVSCLADRRTWAFRDGLRSAVGLAGRFPIGVAERLSRQPFNGIRLVDFAIRLRIRSWALVIRCFFIPLAGCRCRCSPSSLPLSDRFSGSPLIGPAQTEPLPTPDDLADHTGHGFPEGGCLLK